MSLPGQLQLAAVASGSRYLRVSVRLPGRDADLVAWLGHELQHAVKLSGAPEVVDQGSPCRPREGRVPFPRCTAPSLQPIVNQQVLVLGGSLLAGRPGRGS